MVDGQAREEPGGRRSDDSVDEGERIPPAVARNHVLGGGQPSHELDPAPDHRSDQYALACVLYEMLAGGHPRRDVDARHLTDVRPEVPPGVAASVARGLAPDPADRFPSIAAFAAALTQGRRARSASRRTRAAMWATAAAAAVALASLLLSRAGGDTADARRVAIVPFVNRTGSDEREPFGAILAEVVSSRLGSTGLADIVPSASVGAALALTGSDRESVAPEAVRDLTGAGLIIQGSYFIVNDSLGIQPQIIDVTKRASLSAMPLVVVPAHDPRQGIQLVLERVQVILAGRNNPLLAQASRSIRPPISIDAYTVYVAGIEGYYSGDYASALKHMLRSADMDSTFASPLIRAAVNEWNATGNLPIVDSLLRAAEQRRAELLPFDAAQLDWLRAFLDGDYLRAGVAAQRRAELGGMTWGGAVVQIAIYTNQLDKASRDLARLLEIPSLENKPPHRQFQATLLHMRGDHARELREISSAITASGSRDAMLRTQIRALAALGRTEEVRALFEYLAALPFNDLDADIFRETAAELRAHGWSDGANEIGRLAAAHYERIIAESNSWMARFELAATLAELGGAERDRARFLFENLDREGLPLPFSWPQVRGMDAAILGYLGIIATAEEDTTGAEGYIAALEDLDRPYLGGAREYWQARIAATLGQCARAVRFLEAATRKGQPYQTEFSISIAELPEFMTLHEGGCEPYDRFIQPR